MPKNKKRWIFINLVWIIAILLGGLFISNFISLQYQREIDENNSGVIGYLIEKHPELKEDILHAYLYHENKDIGQEFMDDYHVVWPMNTDQILTITMISFLACSIIVIEIIHGIHLCKQNRQIREIDQYMSRILNGDYNLELKDYEEGIISVLKNDIYKMTILLKEQKDILAIDKKYLEETLEDISHQLKTPLTSMYLINDILRDDLSKEKKLQFLDKNQKQLERIEWLITSLLKMSRLDSGTIKLKKETVKVSSLLSKSIQPIQEMIDSKKINFQLQIKNGTMIVDENWTSEALLNIIKNACEHTKDKIIIQSSSNPIYTEIIVSDNGEGINNKDLPHIFKRFYRGNHNKESIGIGLNMSKKIVNMQNGEIEVKTSPKGTEFIVKFYKNVI